MALDLALENVHTNDTFSGAQEVPHVRFLSRGAKATCEHISVEGKKEQRSRREQEWGKERGGDVEVTRKKEERK